MQEGASPDIVFAFPPKGLLRPTSPQIAGVLHKAQDCCVGDGVGVAADAGEQGMHVALHRSSVCLCLPLVRPLELQVHVCGGCHIRDRALHCSGVFQPWLGAAFALSTLTSCLNRMQGCESRSPVPYLPICLRQVFLFREAGGQAVDKFQVCQEVTPPKAGSRPLPAPQSV